MLDYGEFGERDVSVGALFLVEDELCMLAQVACSQVAPIIIGNLANRYVEAIPVSNPRKITPDECRKLYRRVLDDGGQVTLLSPEFKFSVLVSGGILAGGKSQ